MEETPTAPSPPVASVESYTWCWDVGGDVWYYFTHIPIFVFFASVMSSIGTRAWAAWDFLRHTSILIFSDSWGSDAWQHYRHNPVLITLTWVVPTILITVIWIWCRRDINRQRRERSQAFWAYHRALRLEDVKRKMRPAEEKLAEFVAKEEKRLAKKRAERALTLERLRAAREALNDVQEDDRDDKNGNDGKADKVNKPSREELIVRLRVAREADKEDEQHYAEELLLERRAFREAQRQKLRAANEAANDKADKDAKEGEDDKAIKDC